MTVVRQRYNKRNNLWEIAVTQTAEKSPVRRRGRPKTASDDERRAEIVNCALEIFTEHGYAGTTMDLVASQSKVSKRTLYELFPGKTALFHAMIAAHRQAMLDLPRERDDEDLVEALEAIFRVDIDEEEDRKRKAFVQLIMVEAAQFPEVYEIIVQHGAGVSRQLLTDWLARQRDRGVLDIDDPASGARILMDMIFGAMGFKKIRGCGEEFSHEERQSQIRRCIDVFLNGVRPR